MNTDNKYNKHWQKIILNSFYENHLPQHSAIFYNEEISKEITDYGVNVLNKLKEEMINYELIESVSPKHLLPLYQKEQTYMRKKEQHPEKILICNNCKSIWIAPKERCDCGSTTLTETHFSNISKAKNKPILKQKEFTKLTDEILKDFDFTNQPEKAPFKHFKHYNFWVKNGICLFYNADSVSPFQKSYLIGFGDYFNGEYGAVSFEWIDSVERLTEIYEVITQTKITDKLNLG